MPGMPNMPGMQHPQTQPAPPQHQPAHRRHRRAPAHPSATAPAPPSTPAPAQGGQDMSAMPGMTQSGQTPPASSMPGMPGMSTEEAVGNAPPPPVPTDRAADQYFDPRVMAAARDQVQREHGGSIISKVMLNLGEYQWRDGEDGYRWEGQAWIGGDIHRLVIKSEGEAGVNTGVSAGEIQALYSRAITPYFDVQVGVRQDFEPQPRRTYAVLGVEGVAPYWFEVNGALFLSNHGEILGRLEGSYDLRLTQRLILQPRVETNLAAENIPEIGIGAGVSNVELGLRLRYEIRREFAPYVGISFDRKLGDTADFARADGEDPSQASVVFGLRAWF
ncbi:MAG: copper resistance protein B [Proteobacteria bacterium]|nr:copper resistance protein B [Pseudomonadota bacterium]